MPPGMSSSGVSCAPVRPAVPYRVYMVNRFIGLLDHGDMRGVFSAEGMEVCVPYRGDGVRELWSCPNFTRFLNTFTTFTARTLHVGVMQQPAALTSTLMGPSLEARMSAYRAWAAPGRERSQ